MKKSFKIVTGFGDNDFFSIGKNEIARAYHCFLTDGQMITNEGVALRGRNILRIEPDWNEVMGYERDYKLTSEDHNLIGVERKEYANALMGKAKRIAKEVIESGDMNLLSQEITIKQIENSTSSFAKQLAIKKKIL